MTRYLGRRPQADFKPLPHVELRRDVVVVDVADAHVREIVSRPGRGVLGEVDGVPEEPAALHGEATGVRTGDHRRAVPDPDPFARLDRDAEESIRREDEEDRRGAPVEDGVYEHRIHAGRAARAVSPGEAVGNHREHDVGVEGQAVVDRRPGRSWWLELFRLFHLHADAGIAAFGQARAPPAGLDVPIDVPTPALWFADHRYHVRPRTEHLEREGHHDGPQAELVVLLKEALDGQRSVDRLPRSRG